MAKTEKSPKGTKTKKIKDKLLLFIVPAVVVTIVILVAISSFLSKSRLEEMARNELESSITNQADNIYAWLEQNLENQDDAHIFCRPDQVKEEFLKVMDIIQIIFKALDFKQVEAQIYLLPIQLTSSGTKKASHVLIWHTVSHIKMMKGNMLFRHQVF